MKINLNYDGLRSLNTPAEQRTALFNSLKAALLFPVIALDVLGATAAAKAAAPQQALMSGPEGTTLTADSVKAYLQSSRAERHGAKWATPGDNPVLQNTANNVVEFFQENIREMDLGYQVLFDEVPGLLGSNQDSFELIGASMAFTWDQLKPGAAIKPRRNITESITTVKYLEFGDGFSILDTWFQFSKYYHIADAVNAAVSSYYDKKANLHYGLITGQSSAVNVAFDTDAATTFNKAVSGILRKCDGKGYALGANAQVDILVNPEKVGYVLAMLEATRGSAMLAYGTSKQPIAFSVRNVIVTTKVAAADTGYYVVLPGRKLKRADWKALTIESKREPSVAAEDWYGRGQYNAIAGDADQIARVLFG
jgi:hypothetical protein